MGFKIASTDRPFFSSTVEIELPLIGFIEAEAVQGGVAVGHEGQSRWNSKRMISQSLGDRSGEGQYEGRVIVRCIDRSLHIRKNDRCGLISM